MVNGIRTVLPATPKVGASRLSNSTSGSLDELPTGTEKTGTPFIRSREAASTGGWPSFQSPSEARTTPLRLGTVSMTLLSGSLMSVPCPAPLGENGWITTCIVSPSLPHASARVSPSMASRRVSGWAEVFSPRETSRVSMLGEASQSTAIDAFSSGRNSSIHSGWLSSVAASATQARRISSSTPTDRLNPLRRQATKQKPAVTRTTRIDRPMDQGVARKVSDRVAFMVGLLPAGWRAGLGKQRHASATIATIMAMRKSRQISWISEPALSEESSTLVKSSPLNSPANRGAARTGARSSGAGRLTASRALSRCVDARLRRIFGREPAFDPGQPLPLPGVIARRIAAGLKLPGVLQDARAVGEGLR